MPTRGLLIFLALPVLSCSHDSVPCKNPLAQGALLLSEVAKDSSTGQWVELYNPDEDEKTVLGVTLVFTKMDGSSSEKVMVLNKEESKNIKVGPKGYFVLGLCTTPLCPQFVDYPFDDQFEAQNIYSTMLLELYSCGTRIDFVAIDKDLPKTGSFSRDFQKNKWCATDEATPKEENKPCE